MVTITLVLYLMFICSSASVRVLCGSGSIPDNSIYSYLVGRRGGLMVSALDSGSSGPGSGPGRGHCVVFLGKTLYSHGASLHPGV